MRPIILSKNVQVQNSNYLEDKCKYCLLLRKMYSINNLNVISKLIMKYNYVRNIRFEINKKFITLLFILEICLNHLIKRIRKFKDRVIIKL